MIVNQAALSGIYQSFSVLFSEALQAAVSQWNRVAMEVPSTGSSVDYKWLGAFPKMREWIGERYVKSLEAFQYAIVNKNYEATTEVDRNDIEDDQIGVYRPIIQGLGANAALHPDLLIFTLLKDGFTGLGYDGQYFFDTDHPVGSGTDSNHGGGSGTAWYLLDTTKPLKPLILQRRKQPEFVSLDRTTDENVFNRRMFIYGVDDRKNVGYGLWQLAFGSKVTLDAAGYAAARTAMMEVKDDVGVSLNITPNLLVVPPSLESAGRILLKNQNDAAGATNPWLNSAELLVVPWLA